MSTQRINVTKTFLPPLEEYVQYLTQIWERDYLTNQGPLLKDFEARIQDHLRVDNFQFVTNGTLALQLALRALEIKPGSEVITTPFSYVATSSSILWEGLKPRYVDIDPHTFNIDPDKIEASITKDTKAILAVHVFGVPCDVDAIEKIAKKHNLKIIYDAAHAFGVYLNERSIMSYGDISICSFHATKLFHTIEGGGIVVKDHSIQQKIDLMKRFGHNGDDHILLGINAKASEFQAAMGLSNIPYISEVIERRKKVADLYDELLAGSFQVLQHKPGVEHNYSYYPIVMRDEEHLIEVTKSLNDRNIYPRRYFYPSLNELPYIPGKISCPVSEDISSRILCLPLYPDLDEKTVNEICEVIR